MLTGRSGSSLAASVDHLMQAYRSGVPPRDVLLATPARAAAYAGYRMPATTAAVAAALRQTLEAVPTLEPTDHLDLGAGTGAAAVAVAETLPSVRAHLLWEQSPAAVELGTQVLDMLALPGVRWSPWTLPGVLPDEPSDLPSDVARLVTAAYLLGELDDAGQDRLVRLAAAAAGRTGTVLLVEPGTPDGYRRIVTARTTLLSLGLTVAAPCPHQDSCPLAGGRDWCHLAARVERSARHRALKAGELSYEDEKFAYVAATGLSVQTPGSRVLRRPAIRKGLVALTLCEPDGQVRDSVVSKRQGPRYRAARDVHWGDAWPSVDDAGTS